MTYTIQIQQPPGPHLILPTPSSPHPPTNPPIFNDAMVIRLKVFVEEQSVPAENEIDDDDARSWQFVLYSAPDTSSTPDSKEPEAKAGKGEPLAVLRLVPPPHTDGHATPNAAEPHIKLTRVATLATQRGKGLSRELIRVALEWAGGHKTEIDAASASAGIDARDGEGTHAAAGWNGLVLVHAQTEVEKMYERFGFERDEGMGQWMEEGIEHVGMWRRIATEE